MHSSGMNDPTINDVEYEQPHLPPGFTHSDPTFMPIRASIDRDFLECPILQKAVGILFEVFVIWMGTGITDLGSTETIPTTYKHTLLQTELSARTLSTHTIPIIHFSNTLETYS